MAVIWGLDLREMQWGKFKNSYMWNTEYHRRRTKFIVYQLAMILTVVSESLGTAVLSDYNKQQNFVSSRNPDAMVHNNNFIGIASFNIFVGIYVATIFGSAFFFDLFWPERHESRAVKIAWKVCSIFACLCTLACALAFTDILATRSAYVSGVNAREAMRLIAEQGEKPKLKYRDNARAVASVVFLWPGMLATFASTYLLWRSIDHIDRFGPKSKHARVRDDAAAPVTEKPIDHAESTDPADGSAGIAQPGRTHLPEGHHERNEAATRQEFNTV